MAKGKEKEADKSRSRLIMAAVVVLLVIFLAVAIFFAASSRGEKEPEKTNDLLEEISQYKGFSRTVSDEEFEFYRDIVKSDLSDDTSAEELDEKTKKYANEVNAYFYLGNKFNLCEPYDFSVLKLRMEQENTDREVKINNGEVVYGPQSFTLSSYFQYIYSNLESNLLNYIAENGGEAILNGARDYYENNKSSYRQLVSISYKLTENGTTETVTASREEMNTLSNSDPSLADFLATAKEGDKYSYEYYGEQREAELLSAEYETVAFEDISFQVAQNYISSELIGDIIDTVAENNPLIFNLSK